MLNIFYAITICLLLLSSSFVALPIVVGHKTIAINKTQIAMLVITLSLITGGLSYSLYFKLGAATYLRDYYSGAKQQQRAANARLQPLYARLQRELLKAQLNHGVDPANEQLIVNFATIHAKQHGGILPDQVIDLLQNVLKSYPDRGNILGLLAVHHYKSENYAEAIKYWQQIILLIPDKIHYAKEIALFEAKIQQARSLANLQISKK